MLAVTKLDGNTAASRTLGAALVNDCWVCGAEDGLILTNARTGARTSISTGPLTAIAGLRDQLWAVGPAPGGQTLYRIDSRGQLRTDALPDIDHISELVPCRAGDPTVMAHGSGVYAIAAGDSGAEVSFLGPAGPDRVIPFRSGDGLGRVTRSGRRLVAHTEGREVALAIPEPLARDAAVISGAAIDGGARIALEMRGAGHHIVVVDLRRQRPALHLRLVDARGLAWVEDRGHAVLLRRGRELVVLDLLAGDCLETRIVDVAVESVAVDPAGTHLVLIPAGEHHRPLHVDYAELIGERPRRPDRPSHPSPAAPAPAPVAAPAKTIAAPRPELALDPETLALPLLALGRPAARDCLEQAERAGYLEDLFGWVASLCRRALAEAWDSGRVGAAKSDQPYANELEALLDQRSGLAAPELEAARGAEDDQLERFGRWTRPGAPHFELAAELELSPLAVAALLVAAAPGIWGELGRVYAIIAYDPERALVDEFLIGQVLGLDRADRIELARELDDGAPLIRHGLLARDGDDRPFAPLRVPEVIARRLTATPAQPRDDGALRLASRRLDELFVPAPQLEDLLHALSVDRGRPLRLVLRGRDGSGRRTLAAALAARAGRHVSLIDVAPLSLATELRDAALAGHIPCVSGWDQATDDPATAASISAALDSHPGPMFLRGAPDATAPIRPGYLTFDIPRLDEPTRRAAWERELGDRGLPGTAAAALARRYDLGAGVIARVAGAVEPGDGRLATSGAEALLDAAVRRHRADRIARLARRIARLPGWDELILDEDQLASLRELCDRIRLRHTVLDAWGMEHARGITALFQGAPGTGKTLAAGVIARALGYELYRIDLSRIMSRWLGETEKNLAAVFDAAEDGEVVLLFDEADSLFGKRTAVKSSNDRYANLEVNYLLQRLDTFEGIAVLTTNFGTAIDPAFKRRLSLYLQFSRPDAELRRRLWRAHIPGAVPTAGDLELAELAERYELSGGYIRNAALRAAYLAAAGDGTLTAAHLRRAVELEYRDKGKLCAEGVLE